MCTLFSGVALAQVQPSFTIEISPENFGPGESVTISISSFNIPLNKATILWETDGETLQEGVGVRQVRVTAPESGETKEVFVVVTQGELVVEKSVTLEPRSLGLYIESVDGYTPPWYQGRSHIAEESVVKIIAIPDSFPAIISSDTNIYTWAKNGFVDQAQSGRGKQAFITKLSPFSNSEDIRVTMEDTSRTITLIPRKVQISLFEYSPLYGTRFEKELGRNIALTKEDVTLEVIPWFFSAGSRASTLLGISWTLNGLPTRSQGDRSLLNLRKGTQDKGVAQVGVTVRHQERTLQFNRVSTDVEL